jgi:hypothetical protein
VGDCNGVNDVAQVDNLGEAQVGFCLLSVDQGRAQSSNQQTTAAADDVRFANIQQKGHARNDHGRIDTGSEFQGVGD